MWECFWSGPRPKTTTTSYSHDLYLAGCWDLGTTHPKTVYISQYYSFTSMKMLFYWLIIHYNSILMIDTDQSTIIEAPEVYKSIITQFQSKNQRKNVLGKKCWLWHLRWTWPNLQEIIFGPIRVGLITQKQFWDHLKNWHSWGRLPIQLALKHIDWESTIAKLAVVDAAFLFKSRSF